MGMFETLCLLLDLMSISTNLASAGTMASCVQMRLDLLYVWFFIVRSVILCVSRCGTLHRIRRSREMSAGLERCCHVVDCGTSLECYPCVTHGNKSSVFFQSQFVEVLWYVCVHVACDWTHKMQISIGQVPGNSWNHPTIFIKFQVHRSRPPRPIDAIGWCAALTLPFFARQDK